MLASEQKTWAKECVTLSGVYEYFTLVNGSIRIVTKPERQSTVVAETRDRLEMIYQVVA